MIHRVKGFGIVNKTEIYVFLECFCFFDDPADVGHLISGSSAFSKTSLNIWKFTLDLIDRVPDEDLLLGLSKIGFYFPGLQNHCGWWQQPQNQNTLAAWKEGNDKHNVLKKHITANQGPYSQSNGFSSSHVQMWELDHKAGWALKNFAFELWCWRGLLGILWIARRSNQSILKESNPDYSLEGLVLIMKPQYFGYLMGRADSFENTLMLVKTEGKWRRGNRGWEGWMASLTQWTWVWANSRRQWRTGKSGLLLFMWSQKVGHNLASEQQQNRFNLSKLRIFFKYNTELFWILWRFLQINIVVYETD